ncbi:MAG: phytanoyl-CoA dioxygenase family protein [Deinococcales bacterium]|nr:phytanoyl-CoA dioxygenase family protein [Deinococcales bacterium]
MKSLMAISDDVLDNLRTEGYAVVEGFLNPKELAAAREGLFLEYPTPEAYFANPEKYTQLVETQFSGLKFAPYSSWDLNKIAFHPDLVDFAERFCGTTNLELYKIELWAKYSGAIDYDQAHHRDFGNHNMVVPRRDMLWPQLTSFILLSDVTEEDGPTKIVPRAHGEKAPMIPHLLTMGEMQEHEVTITAPAGSLFLYSTDIFHRGSAMTGKNRSRFILLADYSARGNPWMGKMSWPRYANLPAWRKMMERASVRERDLFGFPSPGNEYWNEQTLADVQARYPGMDMTPYAQK